MIGDIHMTVKEMRKLTGLSQTKFANRFHINIDTLRMWEQGRNRTPEHILYMIECILIHEGIINLGEGGD